MKLKTNLILIVLTIVLAKTTVAKANGDSTKLYFQQAYTELKNMLEGKQPINFEKAVFLSENPYWENELSFEEFEKLISNHIAFLKMLAVANDKSSEQNFKSIIDHNAKKLNVSVFDFTENEKKEMYQNTLKNFAIFKYMTDTTFYFKLAHLPFNYNINDPFGKNDWRNSQVLNLLTSDEPQGNCLALTSLYKIFANRLNTEAFICTAPQHIYIQHKDTKGNFYNVELATASHPGDGSLKTLTYTDIDAIANGISLRRLTDDKQYVALCLISLAKSYEHKFNVRENDFILQCAELALKYDSLNLNAMLLKTQVLEERVFNYTSKQNVKDVSKLITDKKINTTYKQLQTQIATLNKLGYHQMPVYMQQMILAGLKKQNSPILVQDRTPNPFPSLKNVASEDKRYSTLSRGLFDEVHEKKQFEQYGHFILNTQKGTLVKLVDTTNFQSIIDPVVFAWQIDPLAAKYPHQSPYAAFNNNPVYYIDPDGREGIGAVDHANKSITIKAVYFTEIGKNGFNTENYKQLEGVNASLNAKGYKVTDEKSALHGYTVQFELQFVPLTSDQKVLSYAVNEQKLIDNNLTGGKTVQENGLNIGNSLILTDDATFEAIPSIKETADKNNVQPNKVLGITDISLQHINIPEKSRGVVKTVIHEIFHTLYLDKDGAKNGIGGGKELPNSSDINTLIQGMSDNKRIVETKK